MGTIYARVSVGGEYKDVAIPVKCYKHEFKNGKPFGERKTFLENLIKEEYNKLKTIYEILKYNFANKITASNITKIYNGKLDVNGFFTPFYENEKQEPLPVIEPKAEIKKNERKFLTVYYDYLQYQKILKKWTEGTIETQATRYKNIAVFLKEKGMENIVISEMKFKVIVDFTMYAYQVQMWSKDYTARHLELIRNVMDYAVKLDEIDKNPFYKMDIEKENKIDKTHLSNDELDRFQKAVFDDKVLEAVKDIFLFMVYTAMNISDYLRFAKEPDCFIVNMGLYSLIVQNRQKLQRRFDDKILAYIPITKEIQTILDKYHYELPMFAPAFINRKLKEIGGILCIGQHKMKTKIARKTFANIQYNSKIDIRAISGAMGHTKTSTTEKYYAGIKPEFIISEYEKSGLLENNKKKQLKNE